MKRSLLVMAVFAAAVTAAHAANPEDRAAELLARLPSQRMLREARDRLVLSWAAFPEPIHKNAAELEQARRIVGLAKEVVPQLRPLIRPGASVFDYRGLLAHGDISWDETSNEYRLYIGVYLKGDQGRQPYDFRITFDAKGKVIAVEDVVWKS